MRNTTFDELPHEVRDAVADHTGRLIEFASAGDGNHAELAGVLRTSSEQVFVKGTRLIPDQHWGGAEAWSLRNEAAVMPFVKPYAPELLWQVETGGWLLLGFEFIDGRHANYAPGSPDLDTVAEVVTGLGSVDCPAVVRMCVEQRYTALSQDAAVLGGASLLHCDINPENVLITPDGQARLVDWAFTSRGAAWLELGFLVPWLLRDGHTAEAAEGWLRRFPAWATADPEHIDLFASLLSRQWSKRKGSGVAWINQYLELTAAWAQHRASS